MWYEKLPDMQTQKIPLVQHQWFCHRQKNVLLHGLRLHGLHVPAQAQPPQKRAHPRLFRQVNKLFFRNVMLAQERLHLLHYVVFVFLPRQLQIARGRSCS
jgi:hypothetical protein